MNLKMYSSNIGRGLLIELLKYILIFLIIDGGVFLVLKEIANYVVLLKSEWFFWLIIVLVILLTFVIMYQKFNKNIPLFPAINSDFEVLELMIIHQVKNRKESNHKRRYKLKAKRNGLRRYQGRFSWTGDSFEIKSGDDRHNVFLSKRVNLFSTYIIDFDRSYNKNEIIEAIVEWNLKGEGEPFISAQLQEPASKLILSVEFENHLKIKNIEFEETYTEAAKGILNYNKLTLQNNCASQIIINPKLLHLYEIRWKW